MPLTKEQIAAYLADPCTCPFCGAKLKDSFSDAEYADLEGEELMARITCSECDRTWRNYYKYILQDIEEEDEDGCAIPNEAEQETTTDNQEFSTEEKVLLLHEGPGIYPPAACTVVEKMVDKQSPCHVCGNLWYGYSGPDYWKTNPSYLLQFETGARGIFPVRRIKKMEG